MRKLLVILLLLASSGWVPAKESDQVKQLAKANEVLTEIMQTPDKSIPRDLLDKAVCVGIVPAQIKFAFGIGGICGRGVLVCCGVGKGSWGALSLFTMGGESFGFQIGGRWADMFLIVIN